MCFYHSPSHAGLMPPTRPPGVPKCTKNALKRTWGHGCVKVWPQCGHGGRKGRQGAPKGAKKVPKTRPGAPRGRLFDILGSKCAPSQNIGIYYVKPTFAPPGGLLLDTPGTQSNIHGTLAAKICAKVMQKMPRETSRVRLE